MVQVTHASAPLHQHLAKTQQGTLQHTSHLHSRCPALTLALALTLTIKFHNHNKHSHHQPSEPFALLEDNSAPQHTTNSQCVSVYTPASVHAMEFGTMHDLPGNIAWPVQAHGHKAGMMVV